MDSERGTTWGWVRRHRVETLAGLYILAVVYNSLVPLDFCLKRSASEEGPVRVLGLPVVHVSIPDAASNVAFYVPLGVLLSAALVKAGWGRWLSVIPTVLFAAGLSYWMESAQTHLPTRIATAFDTLYNIAGAVAGAAASRPLMLAAREAAAKWSRELEDRPSLAMTAVLAWVLGAAALLPGDITFSSDRLRAAVDRAHWVPFEKLGNIPQLHQWEGEITALLTRCKLLRDWWMLALDYATWCVLYATLALAACYYLRTHCRMGALRAGGHALGMCAVYSLGSSALQFFVISRGLDTTVPFCQMTGAFLGIFLQSVVVLSPLGWSRVPPPLTADRARRLVKVGLGVVVAGIVLRETAPFRLETSPVSIAAQMQLFDGLPFRAYQNVRFHIAVDDVVRKLLRFAVLGGLIAALAASKGVPPERRRVWRIAGGVALAVVLFELLQVLLPSRIPGLTDVLLAWFGTAAGVYAHHLLRFGWAQVRAVSPEARLRIEYRVDPGAPDDASAPRERMPTTERPEP